MKIRKRTGAPYLLHSGDLATALHNTKQGATQWPQVRLWLNWAASRCEYVYNSVNVIRAFLEKR